MLTFLYFVIKVTASSDVFGPNGTNYQNDSATKDLSRRGLEAKKLPTYLPFVTRPSFPTQFYLRTEDGRQ